MHDEHYQSLRDTAATDQRDDSGRFTAGNSGGPGRPRRTSPMARFRERLWESITDQDIADAVSTLRTVMTDTGTKTCDRIAAARELLDRSVGRSLPSDLADLVEQAELIVAKTKLEVKS
jgi:hypothetical protein